MASKQKSIYICKNCGYESAKWYGKCPSCNEWGTLDEETIVTGISPGEIISLNAKQFIISSIPNKIFGDNFNFIWPRLCPNGNELSIYGTGRGKFELTYRYPMKIGDCTMDTSVMGPFGCDCIGDAEDNNNGTLSIYEKELLQMLESIFG